MEKWWAPPSYETDFSDREDDDEGALDFSGSGLQLKRDHNNDEGSDTEIDLIYSRSHPLSTTTAVAKISSSRQPSHEHQEDRLGPYRCATPIRLNDWPQICDSGVGIRCSHHSGAKKNCDRDLLSFPVSPRTRLLRLVGFEGDDQITSRVLRSPLAPLPYAPMRAPADEPLIIFRPADRTESDRDSCTEE